MTEPRPTAAAALMRGLQERAAAAVPVHVSEYTDGWWLRHTDSGAWWTGSVLPHRDAVPASLAERIRLAEKFYAAHGAPARFQISPGACPAGLDDALAGRGYRIESPVSLQTAPIARIISRLPADHPVTVADQPADAWLATWLAVHGTADDAGPERAMLHRVDRPSGYASVRTGTGTTAAVARAVVEAGWAGVFGMATRTDARGRGAAGVALGALARWAAGHGAAHMYLQVECENTAARRLYERAGFTELCRYHYRTAGS